MNSNSWRILIFTIFLLTACSGSDGQSTVVTPESIISLDATATQSSSSDSVPGATSTQAQEVPSPEPTATQPEASQPPVLDLPPQTNAAEIRPDEMRKDLTFLSNLIGYQITDLEGQVVGSAADYVINTCETYILYISMDPAEGLQDQAGMRMMLPLEILTINSGVWDAAAKEISLYYPGEVFPFGPQYPEGMALTPTDWEGGVREFWGRYARISNLTTACMVTDPGSGDLVPVFKTAYASDLLGATLRDGLENDLGTVLEALLEPESGKLSHYVVELSENRGKTLVPLGATNIPKEVLDSGGDISLVLLTENEKLFNAPRFDNLESATSDAAIGEARAYW